MSSNQRRCVTGLVRYCGMTGFEALTHPFPRLPTDLDYPAISEVGPLWEKSRGSPIPRIPAPWERISARGLVTADGAQYPQSSILWIWYAT